MQDNLHTLNKLASLHNEHYVTNEALSAMDPISISMAQSAWLRTGSHEGTRTDAQTHRYAHAQTHRHAHT
jgi:hypothetical protein